MLNDLTTALVHIVATVPAFLLGHLGLLLGAAVLAAVLATPVALLYLAHTRRQSAPVQLDPHQVWAGYDGEGVYAWSCTCGEAESDFTGEDDATLAGGQHLLDVGAVPA
jgi:hypothetical protein